MLSLWKRLRLENIASSDHCAYYEYIDCMKDILMWLKESYKPKVKVTRFEYDLLHVFNDTSQFVNIPALRLMKSKGYFKGLNNENDTLRHIIENVKII